MLETAGWWVNEPSGGGAYDVVVSSEGNVSYSYEGEAVPEARFGNRLLEVHGHVARDDNENGVYDTSDIHLPGWIVYFDLNDNGELDNGSLWHFNGLECLVYPSISECLGENKEPYMITQHDGSYHFRNITQGTYHVRLIVPEGWEIANSTDSLIQSGDGSVRPTWLNFIVREIESDVTPTPTVSLTPTPSTIVTPTEFPSPTDVPTPTETPEVTPTETPSPTPTAVPDEPRHDPFVLMRSQFEQIRSFRQSFFQHFVTYIQSQFSWTHSY